MIIKHDTKSTNKNIRMCTYKRRGKEQAIYIYAIRRLRFEKKDRNKWPVAGKRAASARGGAVLLLLHVYTYTYSMYDTYVVHF